MVIVQYRDVGHYIRARSRELGYKSDAAVADAIGFKRSYLSGVINGQFKPSTKRCWQIAEFFEDDPNIILGLTGRYSPPETDNPVVNALAGIASRLPRHQQRDLLRYADYLKTKTRTDVRETSPAYHAADAVLYVELPDGASIEIPLPTSLTEEEIKKRVSDALAI